MKIILTLCLLLSFQSAFSQTECAVKLSELDSFFIQDSKLFKKMGKIERDSKKQILKQTVIMGSGTEVTIAKGGCAQLNFVITMKPQKIQNALPHHLFRQTLQILERFPLPRQEFLTLGPVKKSLSRNNWESIKREGDHYILPCEGATCTLKTIKDGDVERQIEITFSSSGPDQ